MSVWKTVFDFIETNNITFGVADRIPTTLHLFNVIILINELTEIMSYSTAEGELALCSTLEGACLRRPLSSSAYVFVCLSRHLSPSSSVSVVVPRWYVCAIAVRVKASVMMFSYKLTVTLYNF